MITFLDSDDACHTEQLAACAGLLDADPKLDLAFSDLRRLRESGEIVHPSFLTCAKRIKRHLAPHARGAGWYLFRVPETEVLFRAYVVPVQITVIRAEAARAFPFDTALKASEDHQLMLRLARAGKRFG